MFFKKNEESAHKKRGPSLPFVLLRMCLSLIMLSIFGLLILQAFRHFSGTDPLKVDPKTAIFSAITSETGAKLVKDLLSFDVHSSVTDLKNLGNSSAGGAGIDLTGDGPRQPTGPIALRFAVVADSHNDNKNLQKALAQAKEMNSRFVIGLGDYSDVGTYDELQMAKNQFNSSGLAYYSTAGDHDLWDCRNRDQTPTCNYTQLFGSPYQSFSVNNNRFILLYNSDNYLGMDGVEMKWLEDELLRVKAENPKHIFVLAQEPLYHPSSDHYMGKSNPKIKEQAEKITALLKEAGVTEFFAGDAHFYARYMEPKTNLKMTVVGAVTEARNTQKPRFSVVDVYEDGSYNVQDLEIK